MTRKLEDFVARLTALGGGSGDSRAIYQEWASTYETTMQDDYGYIAPKIAADALAAQCPDKDIHILDLGCGTGLVGLELAARGFSKIDGLDVSEAMLSEARKKQVYGALTTGDLSRPPPSDIQPRDAAIAVGCFGGGHLGPQHLATLVGYVKPGGLLVLYVNAIPYDADDYPSRLRALESDGTWQILMTEASNYMQAINRPGWVIVARRSGPDRSTTTGDMKQ